MFDHDWKSLAIGLDEDLDEAMKKAVRESLRIMNEEYGLTKQDALLFGSAAIDYEVPSGSRYSQRHLRSYYSRFTGAFKAKICRL